MDYLPSQSSGVQIHDSTYQDMKFFQEKHKRYKSLFNLILILSTFALGSACFGYYMVYLATIQFKVITQLYNITQDNLSLSVSQGISMAAIPIGAGIGAYKSNIIIQKFSRRKSVLLVNLIAIISTLGVFYKQFYVFVIFRLIQGICTGLYSAIIPMIIKQLSPVQISGSLGVFPQFFICIGCTLGYLMAFILSILTNDSTGAQYWIIMFAFPIVLLSFQSFVLIQIFPYQTPKYLLSKNRIDQTIQLLNIIYKEEYVDEVLLQKKIDLKMVTEKQIQKTINKIRTRISGLSDKTVHTIIQQHQHPKTCKIAFVTAIYLSLLQQFAGPNVAVAYGSQIIQAILPQVKTVIPTLLCFSTIVAAALTIYLLKYFGRKTLLQVGSLGCCITLFLISYGFFTSNSVYIVVGLLFYMFILGFTLGPVVWLYIPQIVQPNYIGAAVMFNWLGASSIIGLYPIVIDILPQNNPGFVFGFFSLICLLSLYISHRLVIQTKDKTQKHINDEYQELQINLGLIQQNQKEKKKNQKDSRIEQQQENSNNAKAELQMHLLKKETVQQQARHSK